MNFILLFYFHNLQNRILQRCSVVIEITLTTIIRHLNHMTGRKQRYFFYLSIYDSFIFLQTVIYLDKYILFSGLHPWPYLNHQFVIYIFYSFILFADIHISYILYIHIYYVYIFPKYFLIISIWFLFIYAFIYFGFRPRFHFRFAVL